MTVLYSSVYKFGISMCESIYLLTIKTRFRTDKAKKLPKVNISKNPMSSNSNCKTIPINCCYNDLFITSASTAKNFGVFENQRTGNSIGK